MLLKFEFAIKVIIIFVKNIKKKALSSMFTSFVSQKYEQQNFTKRGSARPKRESKGHRYPLEERSVGTFLKNISLNVF